MSDSKPTNLQQQLLQRTLLQPQTFASPTDNLMSPCSKKLNDHKNRFVAGSKATKLSFADLK